MARRLLIVLLVLLGVSTLVAALVLRAAPRVEHRSDRATETDAAQSAPIGNHFPVMRSAGRRFRWSPARREAESARCELIRVGDRLTLTVTSRTRGAEIPFSG
jgi:hypothetical protein